MTEPPNKDKPQRFSKTYKGDGYKHTIVDDERGRTHYIDLLKTREDYEKERIAAQGGKFYALTERVEQAAATKGDISGRDLLALLDKLGLGSHIGKQERALVAKHTFHIKDSYEGLEKLGMKNFIAALKQFEQKAWEASGHGIPGLDPSRRHKLTPALIRGLAKVAMSQHLNQDDKNHDPYGAIRLLSGLVPDFDQLLEGEQFNSSLVASNVPPGEAPEIQQSTRAVQKSDSNQRG